MDIMLDDRFDVKPMDIYRWWLSHNDKFLCEKAFQIFNEGDKIFWTPRALCSYLGFSEKFSDAIEKNHRIHPKCVYFGYDNITIYRAYSNGNGSYFIENIIDHDLDIFYELIKEEDFFVMYLSDARWKNVHYHVEVR